MDSIRRAVSFVMGNQRGGGEDDQLELPNAVQRAYVLAKTVGHRGPVVGGYQLSSTDEKNVIVTVTPSGITMVAAETAEVMYHLCPDEGDAFTCSSVSSNLGGLIVGCQSGKVISAQLTPADGLRVTNALQPNFTSCVTCLTALSAFPALIAVGTDTGQLCIWKPQNTPNTVTVSLSGNALTACLSIGSELWIAADNEGIRTLEVLSEAGLVQLQVMTENSPIDSPEGMGTVTDMVYSANHNFIICLSSCSDVFMIDKSTRMCMHRYPATLMTCGASLSSIVAVEKAEYQGSTFLLLGGVDGSLCIRELNRRPRDGKLQCVLHRCFDRLSPSVKSEGEPQLDPSEGIPITSLFVASQEDSDMCIAGDASCALFAVKVNLKSLASVPVENPEEEATSSPPPLSSGNNEVC